MNDWNPSDVFNAETGHMYCYYSGDGMTLTQTQAIALAAVLIRFGNLPVGSTPEGQTP